MDDELVKSVNKTDLTDKEKMFCLHYIKSFNATKSYQKAYGVVYSYANAEGYKLLVKQGIKEELDRLRELKFNSIMLKETDIIKQMADIAFSDVTDYVEFGNKKGKNYVNFKDDQDVNGQVISEVSQGKDGAKVKLHDKMRALEWLADRMDLLPTHTKEKLALEREKLGKNDTDKPIEIVIKAKDD